MTAFRSLPTVADPQDGPPPAPSRAPGGLTLHVVDPRCGARQLQAADGHNLMESLRDGGLSVMALCGGGMSCGTCHVHLAQPWAARLGPASLQETAILEGCERYAPGLSRLSCQIRLEPALDGARLEVIGE